MKKRMPDFREAIGVDQHEAIHEHTTGVAREPGVFRRGELEARHREKD